MFRRVVRLRGVYTFFSLSFCYGAYVALTLTFVLWLCVVIYLFFSFALCWRDGADGSRLIWFGCFAFLGRLARFSYSRLLVCIIDFRF